MGSITKIKKLRGLRVLIIAGFGNIIDKDFVFGSISIISTSYFIDNFENY
jgi:hypothetical protein